MAELWKWVIQWIGWFPKWSGQVSDSDIRNITTGDLFVSGVDTGALNVRAVGKGLNVSPDYEPILGNEFSYAPETPVVQNKIFRLYVDITYTAVAETPDFTYTLSTPSGAILVTGINTITISDLPDALTDIQAILDAAFAAYTPVSSRVVTGTYTGYIQIELTDTPHFNYGLEIEVTTTDLELTVTTFQEPVDVSMIGNWNLIGSNDDTGDDFQFWTTRVGLPNEFDVLAITNPSGSIIQVETLTPHGLAEGQSVRIQGVLGTVEANGDWIAENVTAYTFELSLAVYTSAYVSGGTVFTNIYGLGEIGVAVLNSLNEIEYTRLLRSYELGFSTLKQIDARSKRKQDENKAVYFTEKTNLEDRTYQNLPRAFYYKGAYVTDGAISPNGIYEYGSISSELVWVQSNSNFSLTYFDQIQTGGAVKSGNCRYAARLLTDNFVETQFTLLTDTVPVFESNYQATPLILGNAPDVTTTKINVLVLTNNVVGQFKYVEIAAVNYIGNSGFNAYILGRYELNGQTTQYIEHTGNENNLIDLDAGQLNQLTPGFTLAQNVELLDNRAILSNLTPAQTLDFTDWVETFMYSLERDVLSPIGVWPTLALQPNEYQLPGNVYSKKSHMMYEQYRYGFRFKLKSGGYTQVFYPGYDIRIDLPATLPPERVAGTFTTFDLTDGAAAPLEVYSIYINWLNINMSVLIGGVPAYDLIDEIIPCRATVIPEVLGHGIVTLGCHNSPLVWFGQSATTIGPYSWNVGVYPGGMTAQRQSAFFYCPDLSWKLNDINPSTTGDSIISFGAATRHDFTPYSGPGHFYDSYYAEFNGFTGIAVNPTPNVVIDGAFMELAGGVPPTTQQYVPQDVIINTLPHSITQRVDLLGNPNPFYFDNCVAVRVTSNITNTGSGPNTDYGLYRAIYFRAQNNKYSDPNTTIYTEFLESYKIGSLRGTIGVGDFKTYGDVFTQKTYLKQRLPGWFDRVQAGNNDGFGLGMGYYTQNRNNLQLRTKPTESYAASDVILALTNEAWLVFGYAFPGSIAAANMLFYPLFRDSQLFYNKGYTPRNQVLSERGFNTSLTYQVDWGNAAAWSSPESEGTNTDQLRNFPPLNIIFLDYTNGSITDARAVNGELVTIQPRAVIRQYFDTTAIITTQDGAEVQLGSGAVLSRRGTVMNQFGCSHKWSVVVGLSDKGHDVLYAWDARNKVLWRLGYDGTVALEAMSGMKSFFANHADWVRTFDTPANGQGISAVANQRYREIIWTFRGQKPVPEWVEATTTVDLLTIGTVLGLELLVNGIFLGSLYGWESEDNTHTPDPTIWVWSAGAGTPYAFIAPNKTGFLHQANTITIVPGNTYQLYIRVSFNASSVNPLEISFQNGGPVTFSVTTAGDYYFTYIALAGDDDVYFEYASGAMPGPVAVSIELASLKEIISVTDWSGAPTWLIGSNQATADGSDGDDLAQTVADYIIPNATYTADWVSADRTSGGHRIKIGDALSGSITTNGSHTESLTPTLTGVVSFQPNGGFDGTVKGNIRLTASIPITYYRNDVVSVPGTTTFEGFNDLYICIVDSVAGGSYPPTAPESWELLAHTNGLYYSEFTSVFSELKNKFQLFQTPKPKIYAKFQDFYLVPRPVGNTGRMYQNDKGDYMIWFEDDGSVQSSQGYFDATINTPDERKRFLSLRVHSLFAPFRVNITTPTGISFSQNADAQQREGNEYDMPVKMDSTATGLNNTNTSIMQGNWAILRFIYAEGEYNKINSFIARVRIRPRTTNT